MLPHILAGPIVRHISKSEVTLWLVTSVDSEISCQLTSSSESFYHQNLDEKALQTVAIGQKAFVRLIHISLDAPLPLNTEIFYDLQFSHDNRSQSLTEVIPSLLYADYPLPNFVVPDKVDRLLHGSCRKPHFEGEDGLVEVDRQVAISLRKQQDRPSLLMMSGDQIYADDVAGPMLKAIHQVINILGLYDEQWQGAKVNNSQSLYQSEYSYYHRDHLLPHTEANKAVYEKLFAASKKPIFTSVNAKNHLVTLAECFAMYLLTWSPQLWELVDLTPPELDDPDMATYQKEQVSIEGFIAGLGQVQRALAHLPTYMIFDDHDITDDWNLTRAWEEAAYGHPFSKRIIGNALAAYWLCQGWGNAPEKLVELNNQADKWFDGKGYQQLDNMIDTLLDWQEWHFNLATTPKIVVLDTRTQRWRSESRATKPSGLMDWEALTEMQQDILKEPRVILVSAAPIYGVKMIETIQRIFTFLGQPLMVDAENWMAHKGTANVILNIFRHVKTPPEFIILSGDVHYSFVYDVTHRFIRNSSKIVQVTSSGIKNEFPAGLLNSLDKLNKYLYGPYSPLNWFTKRRSMKIQVRTPKAKNSDVFNGRTLVNQCGIGDLYLTDNELLVDVKQLGACGGVTEFIAKKGEKEQ